MQTHNVTIMLPDIIEFDDRAALQMQVVYVQNLVDAGKIDFNDPAQRDAVLEWYLKIVHHVQLTPEENEQAKAEFRHLFALPAPAANLTKQERWARWQKLTAIIDREADEQPQAVAR